MHADAAAGVRTRMAPGNAGIDLRANLQLSDAERLYAGAGRFTTRNHELADTKIEQTTGDRGQRLLQQRAETLRAEFVL